MNDREPNFMPYFTPPAWGRYQLARRCEMDALEYIARFHPFLFASLKEKASHANAVNLRLADGAPIEPAGLHKVSGNFVMQNDPRRCSDVGDKIFNHLSSSRMNEDIPLVEKRVVRGGTYENSCTLPQLQPDISPSSHFQRRLEDLGTCNVAPESCNLQADDRKKSFPEVLMDLLANDDVQDVISWLPNGKSFAVIRPKEFASDILPKYFTQMKYASFTRKLNRWGFRQILKGPDQGAFHHKLFQKGNPLLCLKMFCRKSGGSSSSSTEKGVGGKHVIQGIPPLGSRDRVLTDDVLKVKKLLARYQSLPQSIREEQALIHSQRLFLPTETVWSESKHGEHATRYFRL